MPCARAWMPWLYSWMIRAMMRAVTGHQKGTKLVTPGINRRSLAGSTSWRGSMVIARAVRKSNRRTTAITAKHNQIENSP